MSPCPGNKTGNVDRTGKVPGQWPHQRHWPGDGQTHRGALRPGNPRHHRGGLLPPHRGSRHRPQACRDDRKSLGRAESHQRSHDLPARAWRTSYVEYATFSSHVHSFDNLFFIVCAEINTVGWLLVSSCRGVGPPGGGIAAIFCCKFSSAARPSSTALETLQQKLAAIPTPGGPTPRQLETSNQPTVFISAQT